MTCLFWVFFAKESETESETLKLLPNLKAPGPDCLPNEYYEAFLPTLLPHMTRLFNGFMRRGEISPRHTDLLFDSYTQARQGTHLMWEL